MILKAPVLKSENDLPKSQTPPEDISKRNKPAHGDSRNMHTHRFTSARPGENSPTIKPELGTATYKSAVHDLPSSKPIIFTHEPQLEFEVLEGNPIELRCRSKGYPIPTVTWEKNGKELTGYHYLVNDNGDLHIDRAQYRDIGQYQCIARNRFQKKRAKEVSIKVFERIFFTAYPKDYNASIGETVSIPCSVIYDEHLLATLDWFWNGQLINFFNHSLPFSKLENGSLQITKVAQLHSGNYSCVIKTRLQKVEARCQLRIKGLQNPLSEVKFSGSKSWKIIVTAVAVSVAAFAVLIAIFWMKNKFHSKYAGIATDKAGQINRSSTCTGPLEAEVTGPLVQQLHTR